MLLPHRVIEAVSQSSFEIDHSFYPPTHTPPFGHITLAPVVDSAPPTHVHSWALGAERLAQFPAEELLNK